MDRRRFLEVTGGLGALSLAGVPVSAAASLPAPVVPGEKLESGGWVKTDQRRETVFQQEVGAGMTVTATAHTLTYEDEALRTDVAEKTLGTIAFAPSSFFASRLDFSPPIDDVPNESSRRQIRERVETHANEEFAARLREYGLDDVERTETAEIEVGTGETAALYRYAATYAFDDITFTMEGGPSITIPGDSLDIDGWLAVWRRGDSYRIAGGGYPAENFSNTIERSLTEAIDVTVSIDLGLTPDDYRDELVSLLTAVK